MRVALYCDRSFKTLVSNEVETLIKSLPVIRDLRVAAESSEGGRLLSAEDVRGLVSLYPAHGVQPVVWPRAPISVDYQSWLWGLGEDVGDGYGHLVYDVEGQAKTRDERLRLALSMQCSLPFGILTTHPGHPEASKRALVMLTKDREIQALSTRSSYRKYGKRYLPGVLQEHAVRRGILATGNIPGLALPLYGQHNMQLSTDDAMGRAAQTAVRLEVPTIAYWSLKHLMRNEYAQEFLRDILPFILGGGSS